MCLADPSGNPRPNRAINLFNSMNHSIDVVGFPPSAHITCRQLYALGTPSKNPLKRMQRLFYKFIISLKPSDTTIQCLSQIRWNIADISHKLSFNEYDVILVEDIHLLPLAFKIKNDASVIFDAREYHPREFESSLLWTLTEQKHRLYLCHKYLQKCDAVLTVSPSLQNAYKENFGITPYLLRSLPYYQNASPKPLQNAKIRLVHHGIANKDRKLELMIEIMNHLDARFTLDFYLTGNEAYKSYLQKLAAKNKRIRFMTPVAFSDLIPTINQYDVGLCFFPPSTFNLKHCLPNKLFEFIQARLAVLTGPSPDITNIVRKYDCGFVMPSFDPKETAVHLNALTNEEIQSAKNASHKAAVELCFEKESSILKSLIQAA